MDVWSSVSLDTDAEVICEKPPIIMTSDLQKNPFIYCHLLTLIVSFFLSIYPVVV